MQMMNLLSAIQFDPHIRGILVVLTMFVILCGSVYLIVATNTGARAGFLVAASAFFGWMFLMGIIWWIYGIGMHGQDPSWIPREVNYSRTVGEGQDALVRTNELASLPPSEQLPDATEVYLAYTDAFPDVRTEIETAEGSGWRPRTLTQLYTQLVGANTALGENERALRFVRWIEDGEDSGDSWEAAVEGEIGNWEGLGGWMLLSEADPRRGEAVASSDAMLADNSAFGEPTSPTQYSVLDVFLFGGKPLDQPEAVEGEFGVIERSWRRVATIFQPKNPPLYGAVTLQENVQVEVGPGEAPPPAQVNEDASVVTSVMLRDLGNRRMVPALFTIFNAILFAVFAWMLHSRDKRAMAVRNAWDPKKAAAAAKEPVKVG